MNPLLLASVCLLFGGGLLAWFALAQVAAQRRMIAGRLARLPHLAVDSVIRKPASLDRAPALDPIQTIFTFGMNQTWGMKRSGTSLLAVFGVLALTALTAALVFKVALAAAAPGALLVGYAAARFLAQFEQGRAEVEFTEHLPGSLDTIVRVLRAGLPISTAIRSVADEAPPAVAQVFSELADQIDIGVSMGDALSYATRRVHLPDFRFFAVSVALQHETGGNLAVTLETLADIVRRRRGVRKKVKALTAEVRMSSTILGAIPIVVLAALSVIAPTYLAPLFSDPRGKLILGAAAGNLIAGFVTIHIMMRRAALN